MVLMMHWRSDIIHVYDWTPCSRSSSIVILSLMVIILAAKWKMRTITSWLSTQVNFAEASKANYQWCVRWFEDLSLGWVNETEVFSVWPLSFSSCLSVTLISEVQLTIYTLRAAESGYKYLPRSLPRVYSHDTFCGVTNMEELVWKTKFDAYHNFTSG